MGLRHDLIHEPVSTLDLRELISAPGDTSVREAVAMMRQAKLGFVVLLDDHGEPTGLFTERRLTRLLLECPDCLEQPIDKQVERPVPTIRLDEPIANLVEMMQRKALRFVVVVDGEGHAVGVTGQKGVMEYVAEHFPRRVKVQLMESKLYMSHREGA
jgi:CBS domain-containing protein